MSKQRSVLHGVLAGIAGGLVASWVMNEFMAGPGQKLQRAVAGSAENPREEAPGSEPKEDSTMKAADVIVSTATGGRHLSWEQKQKGGPIVHYAFGALMGGIYGGLAEYFHGVTSGFGTSFGGLLFGGADMFAVPTLNLSASQENSVSTLATPFAAHIVYGVATESVRRAVRAVL